METCSETEFSFSPDQMNIFSGINFTATCFVIKVKFILTKMLFSEILGLYVF